MIKRTFICCVILLMFFGSHSAFAARHFSASGDGRLIGTKTGDSFTCEDFSAQAGPVYRVDGVCNGLDAAIQAATEPYPGIFHWINSKYGFDVEVSVYVLPGSSCKAGGDAGHYEVPSGYGYPATGEITQAFQDPAPFSVSGCMVALSADLTCYTKSSDGEVAPGIKLVYCNSSFKETGDPGGANGSPSVTQDPYTGGGNTGGGGSGGGTDPGTGGDGGGGTDPGTGGGGGGGTDPGTGGGTDPGTGGGGGTDPGTGGGGGGSGTDFCERHPGSSICQNSGVSGTCENFVCNGDAIQCATLREVHDANCKIAADEAAANGSGIGKLGKGVIDGNDPDADKLPRPGNGAEISVPSLDQSGWLGGGECFSDKTVFIQGREITIPFSKACGALIVLRYAIMIVAALASFKMLAGAIIRE